MNDKNKFLKIIQDLKLLSQRLDLEIDRLNASRPQEQSGSDQEVFELSRIHYENRKATVEKQLKVLDKMIDNKPIEKKEFDLMMRDPTLALSPAINQYSNILHEKNSALNSHGNRRTSNDMLFMSTTKKKITAEIDSFLKNAKSYAQQYFPKRKK